MRHINIANDILDTGRENIERVPFRARLNYWAIWQQDDNIAISKVGTSQTFSVQKNYEALLNVVSQRITIRTKETISSCSYLVTQGRHLESGSGWKSQRRMTAVTLVMNSSGYANQAPELGRLG